MKINIKKTKAMVVSKKPNSPKINIAIEGQHIQQVTSYMYLGSLITEDGRSEKEIKRIIMIARSTFTNMRTLPSFRGINLKTRLRAIKCYICPTLFYEAETWTLKNLSCPDLTHFWCGFIAEFWKYHGRKRLPTRKYWEGWEQAEI